ncbi:hypothetical protein BAZSYMA_ACONTIG00457_4 [Bathymodiolus azoricus thioautotrophic gill symbiont]|uniref:Uncharacterized protein n=1 Tax=Bathymodiolus azoricus thioautotrophic gill symbiont TaxID=235205 RepID=A0A1H6MA06_9GAMM|nr:hypothetical protein BAZSYMA_ACONTIG00457_4 [Bathymodiolus azoricus thioautotrophic gill symbiont]
MRVAEPLVPVNRNSLPATTILLLPTFAKITSSSSVSVILISLPSVNTPLRFTAPSICQASAMGSGAYILTESAE